MNLEKIVKILTMNTYSNLKKSTNLIESELKNLGIPKKDYQDWINKILKIALISTNPKTRKSYLRSYFRIYQEGINKDGRDSSIIIEITKKCNKNCRHCYSKYSGTTIDMSDELLEKIIKFSRKYFKHIFFTGGEPTLDPRVLTIANNNPDVVFFIFTNGSTITDSYAKKLSDLGNLFPLIGIDGASESSHDSLRGCGSYREVLHAIKLLNKYQVSWGCITIVTELNAREVLSKNFAQDKIDNGAFLLRYLEYTPVGPNPLTDLILSGETYYLLEKRKKEIIQDKVIYMQETSQKKCNGLLFFSVDGFIKNCFSFHYAKYNAASADLKTAISKLRKEWVSYNWEGECPLYSDPQGFKNHLEKLGWKHQSTVPEPYLIDPTIAAQLSGNYKTFLNLVAEKGLWCRYSEKL